MRVTLDRIQSAMYSLSNSTFLKVEGDRSTITTDHLNACTLARRVQTVENANHTDPIIIVSNTRYSVAVCIETGYMESYPDFIETNTPTVPVRDFIKKIFKDIEVPVEWVSSLDIYLNKEYRLYFYQPKPDAWQWNAEKGKFLPFFIPEHAEKFSALGVNFYRFGSLEFYIEQGNVITLPKNTIDYIFSHEDNLDFGDCNCDPEKDCDCWDKEFNRLMPEGITHEALEQAGFCK